MASRNTTTSSGATVVTAEEFDDLKERMRNLFPSSRDEMRRRFPTAAEALRDDQEKWEFTDGNVLISMMATGIKKKPECKEEGSQDRSIIDLLDQDMTKIFPLYTPKDGAPIVTIINSDGDADDHNPGDQPPKEARKQAGKVPKYTSDFWKGLGEAFKSQETERNAEDANFNNSNLGDCDITMPMGTKHAATTFKYAITASGQYHSASFPYPVHCYADDCTATIMQDPAGRDPDA